jgi:hypothetical protein
MTPPHRIISDAGNHESNFQGIRIQRRGFRQNRLLQTTGFRFQINRLRILHGRLRKASIDQTGFRSDSEQITVARMMVLEFAAQARSDGMMPIIFLVNNLGYYDYLFPALSPTLNADKIP